MRLLTKEQHEYLVSINKGRTSNETTEMMNRKFNLNLKVSQIRCYRKNHNLTCGVVTRFEKGHVPMNKGTKVTSPEVLAKCSKTWFKKGHITHNRVSVGTEIIDSDGYRKVKIAEPNVWKFKHRLVWEQNRGEIPAGKMITFINGDRKDCRIENLILIDQQINSLLNKINVKARSPELVAVVSDIVQIKNRLKEISK